VAIGDIGFGFGDDLAASGLKPVFKGLYAPEVLAELHRKDISFANQEGPLTRTRVPALKDGPNLWAPPEAVQTLKEGGFDLAMLANNHIMDQGAEAMFETVTVCRAAGIQTLGVGANQEEAYRPVVVDVRGTKIGFLDLADADVLMGAEDRPGPATLDPCRAARAIAELKQSADVIVVSVHADKQYAPSPSPRIQRWYRFLVDCGAHAVIGHHPHIIQGIEVYHGAPILYCLGNFCFPFSGRPPRCWHEGLMARLTIGDGKVAAFEVYACEQVLSDGVASVRPLGGAALEALGPRFERFSEVAGNPGLVREFWRATCYYHRTTMFNMLNMAVAGGARADLLRLAKRAVTSGDWVYLPTVLTEFFHRGLMRKSVRAKQLVVLRGLFLSPVNRDVLCTILEMEQMGILPDKDVWAEFQRWSYYFT
jgi:poly-gamma-glutamate synthesis protein (capsule biosynthesis protein)